MGARSTRFYRRNEAELMEKLGLVPTKNSGAGWVEKEDGQNDYLIAQLKSTDASSISIKMRDVEILEANATTCHKVPVFVIQFLKTDDVFIMARPGDIQEVATYMATGACQRPTESFIELTNETNHIKPKISSGASRGKFWEDKEKAWKQKRR